MFRKIELIASFFLLFGVASAPTLAQSDSQVVGQPAQQMYWNQNGSKIKLVVQGGLRKFIFIEPSAEMFDAGAKPGSLLFEGKFTNEQYVGKAFAFNRRCGQVSYSVTGPVLNDYSRVELHGLKPRINGNCRGMTVFLRSGPPS